MGSKPIAVILNALKQLILDLLKIIYGKLMTKDGAYGVGSILGGLFLVIQSSSVS